MKILVVSQYFWPEDFRINELVAHLVSRGHEVTVLTGQPNYPSGKIPLEFLARPEAFATYHGARILRVRHRPRGTSKATLLLNYLSYAVRATVFGLRYLRQERFDATFVFQTSPVTVGLPAVAFRRAFGWPIVFWVLDQWPETLSAVGVVRSPWLLGLVGRLVSFIYARCDLVLAPSRSLVRRIAAYCAHPERVDYFPNWTEEVYEREGVVPAPEVAGKTGSFSIMFAGNIGEAQDFPAVLDAAEKLKGIAEVRWLIVGDGRAAEWVRQEVARRGLEETFILLGRYPAARMPSFYEHADALLVSLKPDPVFAMMVPGKVQSYLATGRPVIGMLDGEGAAVIGDAGAGLTCAAGDSDGLVENVLRMAAMTHAERAALGARGRAYAEAEFNREILMDRLEHWLMEPSKRPRSANRTRPAPGVAQHPALGDTGGRGRD